MLERGGGLSRLPWPVRVVLLITAAQALLLIAALFDPVQVKLLVPWPASPLNARFIAALYVSLGFGVAIASTARSFIEVRIILVGIVMATVVLLVLTFVRMTLHPGELKQFPLLWVVFYIIDPLMIAVVFWRLRWGDSGRAGWRPVTWLWAAHAAVFGVVGLVLMLDPTAARSLWPWAITEPQAQIYSAFFLTLSAVSILAAREERWAGVRLVVLMIFLLAALVLTVSLIHLPRFTRPPETVLWFAVFATELIAFGALFARRTLKRE